MDMYYNVIKFINKVDLVNFLNDKEILKEDIVDIITNAESDEVTLIYLDDELN